MTYDDRDNYKAAYAYGLERFEVLALDNTRPESQDPLYYLYDGLGSVAQLTRPNGEVRDHYRYDEYGVPAPGAKLSEDGRNVNHNAFGYTGELWDEEDDLLYLRSRYYKPETGGFTARDNFLGYVCEPSTLYYC
jgi:RHS repeat-associated protein